MKTQKHQIQIAQKDLENLQQLWNEVSSQIINLPMAYIEYKVEKHEQKEYEQELHKQIEEAKKRSMGQLLKR